MGSLCGSSKKRYSQLPGTRIFCVYKNKKYYLASHKYYDKDKLDEDSVLLIAHDNWLDHGMNFDIQYYKNGINISYKDDVYKMKDWKLYVTKNKGEYVPVFHKYKSSYFKKEKYDDYTFLLKETTTNLYLAIDTENLRDDNKYGSSYYVGLCSDRTGASRWVSFDK